MMREPIVARQREPWRISFGAGTILLGCLLTAIIFTALVCLWMWLFIPAESLESSYPRRGLIEVAVYLGTAALVLLLLLGPPLAFLIGWWLRTAGSHGLHVLAFAGVGAIFGGAFGALFGPSLMLFLGLTMGVAAGVARAILTRLART